MRWRRLARSNAGHCVSALVAEQEKYATDMAAAEAEIRKHCQARELAEARCANLLQQVEELKREARRAQL